MAQYVPKTAWKVSNIYQRYGAAFVGVGSKSTGAAASFFAGTVQPNKFMFESEGYNSKFYDASQLETRVAFAKQRLDNGEVASANAASFIDLRDEAERQMLPLPFAVAVHHHDVLSGACKPLLPLNRTAEIFVVATNRQRAVNGFNALRRWGYENVVVADAASLARFSAVDESNGTSETENAKVVGEP